MNDLELMHLLEEEGYEPTFENLAILKEDTDMIQNLLESREERAQKRFNRAFTKVAKKYGKLADKTNAYGKYGTDPNVATYRINERDREILNKKGGNLPPTAAITVRRKNSQ